MDMFESYKLTPDDYIPNNLHYDNRIPPKPKYPLVAYNKFDEPIGYTWNYGDSVYLEFETTGNVVYDGNDIINGAPAIDGFVEDAKTYLAGKKFKVELYDFRYNVVAHCECDAAPVVRILSDSFYPCSLVKGVYKLKATIIDEKNNILTTVIDDNDNLIIYIK